MLLCEQASLPSLLLRAVLSSRHLVESYWSGPQLAFEGREEVEREMIEMGGCLPVHAKAVASGRIGITAFSARLGPFCRGRIENVLMRFKLSIAAD